MSVNGMFSGAQESRSDNQGTGMFFQHDPVFFEAVVSAKNEKKYGSIDYTEMMYEDKFDAFGFFSADGKKAEKNIMMSSDSNNSGNDDFSDHSFSESTGHFGFNGLSAFGGYDFSKIAENGYNYDDEELPADPADFFEEFTKEEEPAGGYVSPSEEQSGQEDSLFEVFAEGNYDYTEDAGASDILFTDDNDMFSDDEDVVAEVEKVYEDDDYEYEDYEDDDYEDDDYEDESGDDEDEEYAADFSENVYKGKAVKSIVITSIIAAIFLVFVISATISTVNKFLGGNEVYEGVLLNNKDLGGMTKSQVEKYVQETYIDPVENAHIIITVGETKKTYPLTDFVICPKAADIAAEAYGIARGGSGFSRIRAIQDLKENNVTIGVAYEIVNDKLDDVVASATDISFSESVDPSFAIHSDSVSFTSGKHGTRIDMSKFKGDLHAALATFQAEIVELGDDEAVVMKDIEVEIDTELDQFQALSPQTIYDAVYSAPKSAYYYKDGNGRVVVANHVQGRELDLEELNSLVSRINYGEDIGYAELEFVYIDPAETRGYLEGRLYEDRITEVISENEDDSYSESGWVGQEERNKNMSNAAYSFGTVELLPNDSFSFLGIIGAVNRGNGYVDAYENVQNGGTKIVGGGVSQVASALYTAALKSNLTITEHTNNKYYPNFGIIGFDAFVSSSSGEDLKIRNTRDFPVKINITYYEGAVYVKVYGCDDGSSQIVLNVSQLAKTASSEGARYNYEISKSQGYVKTPLGKVSYIMYGEENPVETATPDVNETVDPSVTADPFETLDPSATPSTDVPVGSEDPSATPGTDDPYSSETPTASDDPTGSETPTDTGTADVTDTPTASDDPNGSEMPTETVAPTDVPTVVPTEPLPTETPAVPEMPSGN